MPTALDLLFVSHYPASPATFGAQRRLEGLMTALAQRHSVSFVGLAPPDFDVARSERLMRAYCRDVKLVPWPEASGVSKRVAQLGSLFSFSSYQKRHMNTPALQRAIDELLGSRRFDFVSVEEPFLAYSRFDRAPAGASRPRVVIDAHNVEFDLARQYGAASRGLLRRIHHAANWRKMRREEITAWRRASGVAFTSEDDRARARSILPSLRAKVVPNGVDTETFRPRADVPGSDGRTIVFFGTMNYFPNLDAVRWLFEEIWPSLSKRHPTARLKIIGSHPPPDVLAMQDDRVTIAGLVDDLPRHLAEAAVVVVPLRIGGGTRLKILESLSMGKAVVSTQLGAEGILAEAGRDIVIADEPEAIVDGLVRVLDEPGLAEQLGENGRRLVTDRYSWSAIGAEMERFFHELASGPAVREERNVQA